MPERAITMMMKVTIPNRGKPAEAFYSMFSTLEKVITDIYNGGEDHQLNALFHSRE
jgi:hypothetical protein